MSILRAFALLLSSAFLGCHGAKIAPDQLVGSWVISTDSRGHLAAPFRRAAVVIELTADGTFSASEEPGGLLDFEEAADVVISGSGTWRIYSSEGEQRVQLVFRAIRGGAHEDEVPYGAQFFMSRERNALTLFYFRGDPDQGDRITFEKRR